MAPFGLMLAMRDAADELATEGVPPELRAEVRAQFTGYDSDAPPRMVESHLVGALARRYMPKGDTPPTDEQLAALGYLAAVLETLRKELGTPARFLHSSTPDRATSFALAIRESIAQEHEQHEAEKQRQREAATAERRRHEAVRERFMLALAHVDRIGVMDSKVYVG